jgi:hypothetical protein
VLAEVPWIISSWVVVEVEVLVKEVEVQVAMCSLDPRVYLQQITQSQLAQVEPEANPALMVVIVPFLALLPKAVVEVAPALVLPQLQIGMDSQVAMVVGQED